MYTCIWVSLSCLLRCVDESTHVCSCLWRPENNLGHHSPRTMSPGHLGQGFSNGPELTEWDRLLSLLSPNILPSLLSSALTTIPYLVSVCMFWHSGSGPHACEVNMLLTELAPQPLIPILTWSVLPSWIIYWDLGFSHFHWEVKISKNGDSGSCSPSYILY